MVTWGGEEILTTPRLSLRTFRGDDLAHYAALNADPEALGGWEGRSPSLRFDRRMGAGVLRAGKGEADAASRGVERV